MSFIREKQDGSIIGTWKIFMQRLTIWLHNSVLINQVSKKQTNKQTNKQAKELWFAAFDSLWCKYFMHGQDQETNVKSSTSQIPEKLTMRVPAVVWASCSTQLTLLHIIYKNYFHMSFKEQYKNLKLFVGQDDRIYLVFNIGILFF